MAKRKTIKVAELVEIVNDILKTSLSDSKERRQGAMNVLETVLHETGNYRGFCYLLAGEVADGVPGINYVDGLPHRDPVMRFANTDHTRVMYF
ncbi:MAG: hypothetical protein ACYDG4_14645 [Desulfuromonadaceae bacterium]